MKPLQIVVLLSGNGSTFQAILDKCQREPGMIEIAAVISNKPSAYGLVRAEQAGVKTVVLEPKNFTELGAYHQALISLIESYLTAPRDLIILAGYMRILSADFVNHFKNRILNIHPSLLPKFPGLHTHARAIEAGETEHGSSIHIVTAELDAGPLVAQGKVEISPEDTAESLEQKVKALEQRLYPETLFEIAKGKNSVMLSQALQVGTKTYFISDLHLSEDNPSITDCFLRFLEKESAQAEALYILGDFFDFWVGDDNETALSLQVAKALKHLSEKGVAIYFMAGNRDFLLGRRYAEACGMTILSDPTRIILYGKPVLLMHGDLLCTDDVKYQQFRRQIRKPWLQKLILSLPLWFRLYLAKLGRQKSREHIKEVNRQIQDVVQGAVEEYMRKWECDLLIHGHTHLPAIHKTTLNQHFSTRIVLAAWHHEGSALCYEANGNHKMTKI